MPMILFYVYYNYDSVTVAVTTIVTTSINFLLNTHIQKTMEVYILKYTLLWYDASGGGKSKFI